MSALVYVKYDGDREEQDWLPKSYGPALCSEWLADCKLLKVWTVLVPIFVSLASSIGLACVAQ